jgi:lipid-binding SYLF domain-containing protein
VTGVLAATLAAAWTVPPAVAAGWNPEQERIDMAAVRETIAEFQRVDPRLGAYFKEAYGYVVFPTIGKGGLLFAGGYGTGKVFERGEVVGDATITQATVGLQVGYEAVSEVVFFADRQTFEKFKRSPTKLAAQASAYAVSQGYAAKAAYSRGVAVFVRAKAGVMAEASIGGQRFVFRPSQR